MDIDRAFTEIMMNHFWAQYQEARKQALTMGPEFENIVATLDLLWAQTGFVVKESV